MVMKLDLTAVFNSRIPDSLVLNKISRGQRSCSSRRVRLDRMASFFLALSLLLALSVFARTKEPPNLKVSVRKSCMFSVLELWVIYWHSHCYSVPFNCVFLRKLYWLNFRAAAQRCVLHQPISNCELLK